MARAKCHPVNVIREPGLRRLRLARGDRYNALDLATLQALAAALTPPVGPAPILILEGEQGMFSVGPDIAQLSTMDGAAAAAFSRLAHAVAELIEAWPAPTIANLAGYCLGSALELALACDVLIALPEVRLGLPGVAWAMVPCAGGLRRLAQRVDGETTSRLFLNGEVLDGAAALRIGLVDRLAESPYACETLAAALSEFGPAAVQAIRAIRLGRQGAIDTSTEAALFAQPFTSGECQKRLKALLAG